MNQIENEIVKCGNCGNTMGEIIIGSNVDEPRCTKCINKKVLENKI